jgi:hypothetical protein
VHLDFLDLISIDGDLAAVGESEHFLLVHTWLQTSASPVGRFVLLASE